MTDEYEQFEKSRRKKDEESKQSKIWKTQLQDKLPEMLNTEVGHIQWRGKQQLPGSEGRQEVDILGEAQHYYIFIELEARRMTCVRNVIKAWMYLAEKTDSKPVLFIHIFSPFLYESFRKRGREESVFVGERAQKDTNGKLTYRHIEFDRWPSESEYATVLDSLVKKIAGFVGEYQS
ncbi:MAG: hypothetical protein V1724_06310 [Chloroflexota bacterium]